MSRYQPSELVVRIKGNVPWIILALALAWTVASIFR